MKTTDDDDFATAFERHWELSLMAEAEGMRVEAAMGPVGYDVWGDAFPPRSLADLM